MKHQKPETPGFNFTGRRRQAMMLSMVLILVSIVSLFVNGLNFGVDFTGGTIIEVGYKQPVELTSIRTALEKEGYKDAIVQHFGTSRDVMIRLVPREGVSGNDLSAKILKILQGTSSDEVEMRRIEFVGPQVGDELRDQGGIAMIFALIFIMVYIIFRFELRFSLGAVAALVHDVIITVGFFSVTQAVFDLTVLASILAVIGYSLNDTIVVYDRIRENFRKVRKRTSEEIVNISLNQTLSRTLKTSITTLLVLLALFFLGGELIHGFATALIIGIVVGTYSSIYVASSAVLAMNITKEDLMPIAKEGADPKGQV